jgi:hypothetical protein
MAGGTDFKGPSRTPEEAETIFKNAMQEHEETTREPGAIRNVFISFHVEDEAQVNLLRSQAKDEATDLEFRDYSVKEPFDEKWKKNCTERISQTSATIVMIGSDTASREAVNWEIEESYKQGHKVIGVRIYRDRSDPIPKSMQEHNAPVVNWDLKEIRKLLDDH